MMYVGLHRLAVVQTNTDGILYIFSVSVICATTMLWTGIN